MICMGCEEYVVVVFENMGVKGIEVDFCCGEVVFELMNDVEVEIVKKVIVEVKYQLGEVEEL